MTGGRVVLAGGSGFLGRALAEALLKMGREVVVLTRRPRARGGTGALREVAWDGRTLGLWARELEGAEAVVNLTGKSVNCRYTARNRREIVESRVRSVEVIARAIRRCERPPKALVQAASLAIYGDTGARVLDESAPAGRGFSAETCVRWEAAFNSFELPATRKVILRIGFVLGRGGGALRTLARLARFYLGGTVGAGRQYVSWLHQRDFNRIVLWCVENEGAEGVYNATGPAPVTNAEFMCELRCALRRPWSPRVPAWAVRLGALLMGTEGELALHGRRALPERLIEQHFKFMYTNLEGALLDIFTAPEEVRDADCGSRVEERRDETRAVARQLSLPKA
jgi:uncharacterized protein (TIGR01777 family)